MKKMLWIVFIILAIWLILTVWVEMPGKEKSWYVGEGSAPPKALIVYDPDPIYNLDEKVCQAFAEGLKNKGIYSTVATVKAARKISESEYGLFVFCANTYNWRPDWAVNNYVEKMSELSKGKTVAITLGAGSTKASQKAFEKTIKNNNGNLIDSRPIWLMRPNDEERTKEDNIMVAVDMVEKWAEEIAATINKF